MSLSNEHITLILQRRRPIEEEEVNADLTSFTVQSDKHCLRSRNVLMSASLSDTLERK